MNLKLRMDKFFKYSLLVLLAFTLSSCDEPEPVSDIKIPKRTKVKKVEVEKEEVKVSEEEKRIIALQNMRAGRNPFQSYIRGAEEDDLGPLECCDITQFRVLAVIVGMQGGNKAKIVVPGGQKYTIQVGTKIGNRKGKVYKIASGTVFIKEKHKNVLGEEETVRVEITLPQAQ